jgi:hypothetical protein
MFIFHNFLDPVNCANYKKVIEDFYLSNVKIHGAEHVRDFSNKLRTLDISANPIGTHVTDFLESQLRLKLDYYQIILSAWPPGTNVSVPHRHNEQYRSQGDYNSILYLNDDFKGGEFYTEHGVEVKPKKGMLTFFDGKNVTHGVKDLEGNVRYNIIFWWHNTRKDTEVDNKLYC